MHKCTICNYFAKSNNHYKKHLETKKHELLSKVNNIENSIEINNNTNNRFICIGCNKDYKHKNNLSRHYKTCILYIKKNNHTISENESGYLFFIEQMQKDYIRQRNILKKKHDDSFDEFKKKYELLLKENTELQLQIFQLKKLPINIVVNNIEIYNSDDDIYSCESDDD